MFNYSGQEYSFFEVCSNQCLIIVNNNTTLQFAVHVSDTSFTSKQGK